ncbi:tRNA-dihydrouridine synthase [bacterium 1xD42-62]|uniref:tRNA-dihydrouridine synthase n=2 Tax=Parablautia muri TaxID=2320879 RepID=A0A9X5BIY8_9FIRM|nr:tRNA-dihydrouridine synthase [Parablautia muri]NBJ94633.1 tRNA-dihydrouridine synthase [Parablautia muri]
MQFYLAPMEEVTGYVYRNVYHMLFDDVDKYFMPFIAPTKKRVLKTRDRKETAPENNQGVYAVPQILTNHAEQFLDTCDKLLELGYYEINLNLGCPSATVVRKAKGSGFLADTGRLDRFFEVIFRDMDKAKVSLKISVKTRIGLEFPEEFEDILKIFNRYPISEVIIHPRLQKDYYNNTPDLNVFSHALAQSVHPLCYNGDIFTKRQYDDFIEKFPTVERIMLGRGIVANPGLVREVKTGERISKEALKEYHDKLYAGYREALGSEKDALFKMKELWFYLGKSFTGAEKYLKKIRKANRPEEYASAVNGVFK